jgi:hypothetical protein
MIEVTLINDKTSEVFTVVELEDDTVEIIKKLGLTIEEGIKKALTDMIEMHKKDPKGFEKMMKKIKKENKSP